MNRAKIEDVLLKMGVPAGIKGFIYIADAVEYIDEHGTDVSITKWLYLDIAKKRNTAPSRVERAIRHAFRIARSGRGDYKVVEKYIGFMHCENSNSLMMLYAKIKQECAEKADEAERKEETEEADRKITALEIREIFRQELRLALNELRKTTI